jgi:hypothetical protein
MATLWAMTDRLDDALVDAYVGRFLGHGSFKAPFWFIGREEGGEDDVARIRQKLESWNQKGRPELETLGDPDQPPRKIGWGNVSHGSLAPASAVERKLDLRRLHVASLSPVTGELLGSLRRFSNVATHGASG